MKKQKLVKVLCTLLLIMVTLISLTQIVYAGIDTGITGPITPDKDYTNVAKKALGVVQYICYGAAVIVTMIIGVQFMTAAPEGKAEVKKKSIYMAIGAGILFAIGAIGSIINKTTAKVFPS